MNGGVERRNGKMQQVIIAHVTNVGPFGKATLLHAVDKTNTPQDATINATATDPTRVAKWSQDSGNNRHTDALATLMNLWENPSAPQETTTASTTRAAKRFKANGTEVHPQEAYVTHWHADDGREFVWP